MSISQKLENGYKNQIKNIKKEVNSDSKIVTVQTKYFKKIPKFNLAMCVVVCRKE